MSSKKLLKITITGIIIGIITMTILFLLWFNAVQSLYLHQANDNLLLITTHAATPEIIIEEVEVVVEKEPNLTYLGNWKITHYCHCKICCGKDNGITATGAKVQPDHTIAVDPKVIPYGSKVMISGIVYTAEDCGGGIKENRIDIYCSTHEEAKQRGVIYRDVYLVNYDE